MVPVRTARMLAIILTLFAGPACATDGPNASSGADSVKAGSWGGAHIAMTVGGDRTDVEFDCAKASISGAIAIDRDGAFSATGTLQTEGPGPTRPDGPPPRPMRLSGTVKGDDMQVHVVLTDQNEDAGTFTLTFGAAPRLTKCR